MWVQRLVATHVIRIPNLPTTWGTVGLHHGSHSLIGIDSSTHAGYNADKSVHVIRHCVIIETDGSFEQIRIFKLNVWAKSLLQIVFIRSRSCTSRLGLVFSSVLIITKFAPAASGSGIPEIKGYLNGVDTPGILLFRTLIRKESDHSATMELLSTSKNPCECINRNTYQTSTPRAAA
ncbi:hypothetical protein OPV22_033463 [Ensete ventricosum]|uniref:Uncharacterized protein n=1 Tax=Ensete ventricosum TaxID=4639 RepID=A0AAV8PYD4_ENSVE|nr:hypothetical protein OPV22_033463 [Ensete ventricosum]